jgi:hypothetical protein
MIRLKLQSDPVVVVAAENSALVSPRSEIRQSLNEPQRHV